MRSLKNRNACRAPENSMVMRLLIMPVENSACAAKRRSRETAVCAAMTAAHQKSSVLYCAFHVCRAVRKICGMGCGSVSKSSSAVCKARLHAMGKDNFSAGLFAACAAYTINTSAAAQAHSSPAQRSAVSAKPCAYPCVSEANRADVRQIAAALESSA